MSTSTLPLIDPQEPASGSVEARRAVAYAETPRLAETSSPWAQPTARVIPRWWKDASVLLAWGLGLFVVALWVSNAGLQQSTAAGWLTSSGRLTGLVSSYLLLLQVFLMARIPFVEQAWGQDGLTRLHRWVGFTSFTLMLAHIGLIILGYASGHWSEVWSTLVDVTLNDPGMLLAAAGTVAIIMVVVTSYKAARKRLRYESWHLIHLYAYLGVGLALPHQLWTGTDFLASPTATVFWWTLYIVCLGVVLIYRLGVPVAKSLLSRIRVDSVTMENPRTVTVRVSGPGVRRLNAQGGQFFQWRFLDGPGWTRANPYSLSAAPRGNTMAFTASVVGDGSARLTTLKPGTRVMVEGPYGRMHAGSAQTRKALLMGAGIGITPMKALLESFPAAPGGITVLHRYSRPQDLVLHREMTALAEARGAQYYLVEGGRTHSRESWLPERLSHMDDVDALFAATPDLLDRDIFVCGSEGWMNAVSRAALDAGVPRDQIHVEHFSY